MTGNAMNIEIIPWPPDPAKAHLRPVLFVHGAWHGAWCWKKYFLKYFEERGFAAYALSLRGHGESDTPERFNRTRLSAYVDDLHGVAEKIASHHGRPPVLVGHSMGGAVVQKYLETHPKIPAAVLMASIPPRGVLRATLRIFRKYPRLFARINWERNLYLLVETPERAKEFLFSEDMPDAEVLEYHRQLGAESYFSYLDTLRPFYLRPKRVKTRRVLVLGAKNDAIFEPHEIKATASKYKTTAVIFDGMAHDMMLEAEWRKVADRIIAWLQQENLQATNSP